MLASLDETTVKELGRRYLEMAGPDGYCLGGTAFGTYMEKPARNFVALAEFAEEFRLPG